jgi:hypothetical protein
MAASELTVTGTISSNGEDTSGESSDQCDDTIGAGAGAGGSIYIVTQTANLDEASIFDNGAGSTYISQSGVSTGVGVEGRIHIDFSTFNDYNYGNSDATVSLENACLPSVRHREEY